jgi:tRNA (cytosine49-C5)-methyltransferase
MKASWESLPEPFLQRLSEIIPQNQQDSVLQSFTTPRITAFRINTIKAEKNSIISALQNERVAFQEISWYKDAFILVSDKKRFMELPLYKQGLVYIQNVSSMIPPLVLDPKPDDRVLDIAAAPGSKTTQLACLMQNSGEIVANDISRARLYKLQAVLQSQGVSNVSISHMPGERMWKKYPEYFDKVLVDAPCTMEGRITTLDPASYKDWSLKKIKALTQSQRYLLRSAVSSVKSGGVVVYSTCTLAPEENEEIINWLLQTEKDAVAIEAIHIQGLPFTSGLGAWRKKKLHDQVLNTARILPSETMEGFYIAKLRKIRSTLSVFS